MSMKGVKLMQFIAPILLEDGAMVSDIEVLRTGTLQDRGLNITKGMLEDYVRNHQDNVYGTEIQVNFEHKRGGEAAGWFKSLYLQGESLMGQVEWTELGAEKIRKKLYKFISSELAFDYPHHATGQPVSNVFIGAALTNTPALKGQMPITFSEEIGDDVTNSNTPDQVMFKKLMEDLKARTKLSEADVKLAKALLEDVPEGEKEAAAADVAALEKKQQDEAAAAAAANPEGAGEAATLREQLKNTVPLSEHLALKDRFETRELTEQVQKELVLNDAGGVSVGFLEAQVPNVVAFLKGLDVNGRKAFLELMKQVKSVDFEEHGSTNVGEEPANKGADLEEKIVARAKQLLSEGKAKDVTEAQKMATAELSAAK